MAEDVGFDVAPEIVGPFEVGKSFIEQRRSIIGGGFIVLAIIFIIIAIYILTDTKKSKITGGAVALIGIAFGWFGIREFRKEKQT